MRLAVTIRLMWSAVECVAAGRSREEPVVALTAGILALRHLVESVALIRARHRRPPAWAVWIEGAHGASMVAVAIVSRNLRRDAAVSAVAAGVIASVSEVDRAQVPRG